MMTFSQRLRLLLPCIFLTGWVVLGQGNALGAVVVVPQVSDGFVAVAEPSMDAWVNPSTAPPLADRSCPGRAVPAAVAGSLVPVPSNVGSSVVAVGAILLNCDLPVPSAFSRLCGSLKMVIANPPPLGILRPPRVLTLV